MAKNECLFCDSTKDLVERDFGYECKKCIERSKEPDECDVCRRMFKQKGHIKRQPPASNGIFVANIYMHACKDCWPKVVRTMKHTEDNCFACHKKVAEWAFGWPEYKAEVCHIICSDCLDEWSENHEWCKEE